MRKVLVTGGAGYIGSNVVDALLRDGGYEVFVIDNLSVGMRELVPKEVEFRELDLLDFSELLQFVSEIGPDCVVHLAGVSEVGESQRNPEKYFQNNVVGGSNLLKAMAEAGCREIVFSSSAAVYGEPVEVPITEQHVLRPLNFYGKTKAVFEKMLKYHAEAKGLRYFVLRYFNAGGASGDLKYGERHDPESHLIPAFLKALKGERGFKVFGNDYDTKDGTCVRDYIHVADLANAHLKAVEYLAEGKESEVVNLGSGKGYSVKEIVEKCLDVSAKRDFEIEYGDRRPGDPEVLIASHEKALKLLGWSPVKGIDEIVKSAYRFEFRDVV